MFEHSIRKRYEIGLEIFLNPCCSKVVVLKYVQKLCDTPVFQKCSLTPFPLSVGSA